LFKDWEIDRIELAVTGVAAKVTILCSHNVLSHLAYHPPRILQCWILRKQLVLDKMKHLDAADLLLQRRHRFHEAVFVLLVLLAVVLSALTVVHLWQLGSTVADFTPVLRHRDVHPSSIGRMLHCLQVGFLARMVTESVVVCRVPLSYLEVYDTEPHARMIESPWVSCRQQVVLEMNT
jgi:hypothetical protein